jgi:hypothetical protein
MTTGDLMEQSGRPGALGDHQPARVRCIIRFAPESGQSVAAQYRWLWGHMRHFAPQEDSELFRGRSMTAGRQLASQSVHTKSHREAFVFVIQQR